MRGALLDTMAVLRAVYCPKQLSRKAGLRMLEPDAGPLFYSVASLWEIGLKMSRGGYPDVEVPADWNEVIPKGLHEQGINRIEIEPRHCKRIETLPFHHKAPFDRMILAQALAGDLELISSDAVADDYGLTMIW